MCGVHHNSKINEGSFIKCFNNHKYIFQHSLLFVAVSYFQYKKHY